MKENWARMLKMATIVATDAAPGLAGTHRDAGDEQEDTHHEVQPFPMPCSLPTTRSSLFLTMK